MLFRHFLLFVPVLACTALQAQTNSFELHIEGKKVGTDTYTLTKAKHGYKLMSHLGATIHGTEIDYRDTLSYTDDYEYIEGAEVSQAINQQTSWIPSKDGKEITIGVSAAGLTSSNIEPITPNLVLLPAFDAGAAQALLLLATGHPTPKSLYSVYLPNGYNFGGAGGGRGGRGAPPPDTSTSANPGGTLPPGIHCFTAVWAAGAPLTGTLEGKPLKINTYMLAFGNFRWIFFADESNNLMQVNVSLLHASYIRSGFRLDPPPGGMSR